MKPLGHPCETCPYLFEIIIGLAAPIHSDVVKVRYGRFGNSPSERTPQGARGKEGISRGDDSAQDPWQEDGRGRKNREEDLFVGKDSRPGANNHDREGKRAHRHHQKNGVELSAKTK